MPDTARLSPEGALQQVKRLGSSIEKWAYCRGIRSAAELTLPDFLGIGAQKAGTSWLDRNLRCHPGIYMPNRKELHYFDRSFHRSLRHYAANFAPGRDRMKGEITPSYSILPLERIRFIRGAMPDVRLILLLRDPVDRAWSHALMELVTRPGRSLEEVPSAEFHAHFRSEASLARGSYSRILETWLSCFEPEQFYVGSLEQIAGRPEQVLREVFAHLGVDAKLDLSAFPLTDVVRAGPGIPMPDAHRAFLTELYAGEIRRFHQLPAAVRGDCRFPNGDEEEPGVRAPA